MKLSVCNMKKACQVKCAHKEPHAYDAENGVPNSSIACGLGKCAPSNMVRSDVKCVELLPVVEADKILNKRVE